MMTTCLTVRISRTLVLPGLLLWSIGMGVSPGAVHATSPISPDETMFFQPGESFHYVICWLGIPVGSATMEIRNSIPIDHHPTLQLLTTATSNTFLSRMFPVSNRVESTVDARSLLPFHMIFQRREGERRDNVAITFDREEGRVRVMKNGKTTIRDIPSDIHDALSGLYHLRRQPSLETGSSIMMQIHHNKKNYDVEAKVEAVESLKGPWGTMSTIRVLVIMPFQGIFLNEGNIRVWLTDDRHHTPLMMKAKITLGSIKAILQETPSS